MNSETGIVLNVRISHTNPKTPFINFITHANFEPNKDELPEKRKRVLLLNKGIFLKSEFAKASFRIIKKCYKEYSTLDDEGFKIRPIKFFPALREIDALIFELSSILDFFAREINTLLDLSIPLKKVNFSNMVSVCRKKYPNEQITIELNNFFNSESHRYFRGMRNRITHRLPFVTKGKLDQIFFPDDPDSDDVDPLTEKNIDVLKACKKWLHDILLFVDQTSITIYTKIARIKAIDNKTGKEVDFEERFRRK